MEQREMSNQLNGEKLEFELDKILIMMFYYVRFWTVSGYSRHDGEGGKDGCNEHTFFFKGILFCLSSSIFEMEAEFYDLYFFPIRFPGIASVLFPLLLLLFHKTCMFV